MSQYYGGNHSHKETVQEHNVVMKDRKLLDISGVKQVESFDNEEFLLETVMGPLAVRGENLQMKNLDVDKGVVSIKGKIYEVSYLDDFSSEKAKGIFSKLFK
ncbi:MULTISPECIES: sporulation protein YabP [Aeribacillus]|uniref:Sporulation protein YabP n=1 Tax=Aeribacillus pallidus TaxID=33936 RepID=A0A223E3F5_9BACI|nr:MULTISPECIES: sporulation protein YabP [Aeribacillus]ASS89731.1 sporulation protein YabP [Aeribacillus pallidus]MED1439498.1 sporulation protein YabP [Aeribacillus composti]RZI51850.1 sporulation protein YabP [Aeribacillus pallidus]